MWVWWTFCERYSTRALQVVPAGCLATVARQVAPAPLPVKVTGCVPGLSWPAQRQKPASRVGTPAPVMPAAERAKTGPTASGCAGGEQSTVTRTGAPVELTLKLTL